MASVIREGGNSPLEVKTWYDALKVYMLERMYDGGRLGVHKNNFWSQIAYFVDLSATAIKYSHKITNDDVNLALKEMYTDGWIEAADFIACSPGNPDAQNALKHAHRFRLTQKGYDRVPEHILP